MEKTSKEFALTRRAFLARYAGCLGSLAFAHMLASEESLAAGETAKPLAGPLAPKPPHLKPRAKSVICLFQHGGPSQMDLFDAKPELGKRNGQDYPGKVEAHFHTQMGKLLASPFKFNPSGKSGMELSELLPHTATWMHKAALVRTVCHDHNDHGRGSYWMFTGYQYPGSVPDVNSMSRSDMPHMGSVLAKVAPGAGPMFPFAIVPHRMDVAGGRRAGQFAGSLGGRFDPMLTGGNPNDDNFRLDHLPLAPNEEVSVLRRRLSLADQLGAQTQQLQELAITQNIRDNQARALDVLSSPQVRKAVDLSSTPKDLRERYGRNLFGQSVLLGKRLLDAGARLVQCNWQRTQGINGFAWDTHWNNFTAHKEDLVPPYVSKVFYLMAPALAITMALLSISVIPFGPQIKIGPVTTNMQMTDLNIGVLFVLAASSMGVYGIALAGWASNNKYSLLGGLRSSAQMISYELPLSLAIASPLLISNTLSLRELVERQAGSFWNWNLVGGGQIISFFIFIIAGFAETNRVPFDLPEAENELVAGFHTEYSSMKFASFFMAEYANMITVSAMATLLFLGGWMAPWPAEYGSSLVPAAVFAVFGVILLYHGMHAVKRRMWDRYTFPAFGIVFLVPMVQSWLLPLFWFLAKTGGILFVFIWIRATLPRFRYDQLMNFTWKFLFPVAMLNLLVTAFVVAWRTP